jgi:hypothetical protein
VDDVRRRLVGALFDGVRGTNRMMQAICDRSIEFAKDADRWTHDEAEGEPALNAKRADAIWSSRQKS